MSACFGAVPGTPARYCSSSGRPGGGRRPWRWWRAKCAGIAAAVGSRLRRSVKGVDARRRRRAAASSSPPVWCHHHRQHCRSFAPVYVDELYSHYQQQQQPAAAKALRVARREDRPTSTISDAKLAAAAAPVAHAATAGATGIKATARVGAADASRVPARVGAADARRVPARACGAVATAAAAGAGAMRNVVLRSPGRGGGGVLGVVKGMGEVDLRAELFIRKFKEDMRLQSQRSAEEFQAMLARGL